MKAYKAIIFDMDGTLFDTEQFCFNAWDHVNEEYNIQITKEMQFTFVGQSKNRIIERLEIYLGDVDLAEQVFNYHVQYRELYILENGLPQKGDLKKLLQCLKDRGYKIAIATSSARKQTEFNLKLAQISEYFDELVCGDEVTMSKPNPEIYNLVAQRLRIEVNQCLVIEDSLNGVLSAYEAKMDVIMIPDIVSANEDTKKMTVAVLAHLDELPAWLLL